VGKKLEKRGSKIGKKKAGKLENYGEEKKKLHNRKREDQGSYGKRQH